MLLQKLYRFINCVELVSPHHAARELVNTIRQGHFTSLFQKSVKRVIVCFYNNNIPIFNKIYSLLCNFATLSCKIVAFLLNVLKNIQ